MILKLEPFEGPLDLLLHLVRVHEIEIFNIDIVELANQYLRFLRSINFEALDVAADFIAMASLLTKLKTKKLLPTENSPENTSEVDDDETVESLQQRLIEYDRLRGAAEFLRSKPVLGDEVRTSQEWSRLLPKYEGFMKPLRGRHSLTSSRFRGSSNESSFQKAKRDGRGRDP